MIKSVGLGITTGLILAYVVQLYGPNVTFLSSTNARFERMEYVLQSLVSQENSVPTPGGSTHIESPRIAIGFGACQDIFADAQWMFQDESPPLNPQHVSEIATYDELKSVFAYFFQHGAAAERFMSNDDLFTSLVDKAKEDPTHRFALGGNAPVMALRFAQEGARVLLGGRMTQALRKSLPDSITLAGSDNVGQDDVHLILEYKMSDEWDHYKSPRANRFIVHSDVNNPMVSSLEDFSSLLGDFDPNLLLVGGLQMMDNFPFQAGERLSRLMRIQELMRAQSITRTRVHFEMASFVDETLLLELTQEVIPYADSLGMNEQELPNLLTMLKHGNISYVSDSNPRIATVLDQMREMYTILGQFQHRADGPRPLTRIHVHTLAYQAFLVKSESLWKNTRVAAAKASLTAHRHVCASAQVDLRKAFIIMDESFSTSGDSATSIRIPFDAQKPVACWLEEELGVQFCVAPNLVCSEAQQTAGGGDNISAAGLILQI